MFGIADIYAIFFIVTIMLLTLPGVITLFRFGFPQKAGRAERRIENRPWLSLILGFTIGGSGLIFAAGLMGTAGPAAAVGIGMGVLLLIISFIGAAGLASLLGKRIFAGSEGQNQPRSFFAGVLTYELAIFFPVAGWIVFFPILFSLTLGAGLLAVLGWERRAAPVSVLEPESVVIRG